MSPAGAAGAGGHVRVTQVRSGITTKPKHRATLRALGLRGVGRSRVLADNDVVRGMVARVPHLVEVGPASDEEARAQRARSDAARAARRRAQGQETAPEPAPARRPTRSSAKKANADTATVGTATEEST